MKCFLFFIITILCLSPAFSQNRREAFFYTTLTVDKVDSLYRSDAYYSPPYVQGLRHAVDSINKFFSMASPNYPCYSRPQGIAYKVTIKNINPEAIIADLKKDIGLQAFRHKYPLAVVSKKKVLLVQSRSDSNFLINMPFDGSQGNDGGYFQIVGYWGYKQYSRTGIDIYYFPEGFGPKLLPELYADVIRYYALQMEPVVNIAKSQQYVKSIYWDTVAEAVKAFLDYTHELTHKPLPPLQYFSNSFFQLPFDTCYAQLLKHTAWRNSFTDSAHQEHLNTSAVKKTYDSTQNYKEWFYNRFGLINREIVNGNKFQRLFKAAIIEALATGHTCDEMEDYIERYYNKETAIRLKRGKIIVTSCGSDHARLYNLENILRLSAETGNSQLYVSTALTIEHESEYLSHFMPMSLGLQYSNWIYLAFDLQKPALPKTMFGEVEQQALTTFSLRYIAPFIPVLLSAIQDTGLDLNNRLLCCNAYKWYIGSTNTPATYNKNVALFKSAIHSLPDYVAAEIKIPPRSEYPGY